MTEVKEITKWIHCNRCNRYTEHLLVANFSHRDNEEIGEYGVYIEWEDSCNTWQCRGCKDMVVEKTHWFSEEIDFDGQPIVSSDYFPPREVELIKIKIYKNIPVKLNEIYKEVVRTYNSLCEVLCAMGLRALLEGILVDKAVSGRNLYDKIEHATFIPENIRKNLHGFRFLGNDAAHELDKPNKDDLLVAIYVIEDILNVTYELDYKSKIVFDKFSKGRQVKINNP